MGQFTSFTAAARCQSSQNPQHSRSWPSARCWRGGGGERSSGRPVLTRRHMSLPPTPGYSLCHAGPMRGWFYRWSHAPPPARSIPTSSNMSAGETCRQPQLPGRPESGPEIAHFVLETGRTPVILCTGRSLRRVSETRQACEKGPTDASDAEQGRRRRPSRHRTPPDRPSPWTSGDGGAESNSLSQLCSCFMKLENAPVYDGYDLN